MKHLYLILFSTFIMGFVSGSYIFFASRTIDEPAGNTDVVGEFVIVADMYGGCELLGCPSYRLAGDGSYTFIGGVSSDTDRVEGTISTRQIGDIGALIEEQALSRLEDTTFEGTCPVAFDGPAYIFEIVTEEERYRIDTCAHDTEGAELVEELVYYFDFFTRTHGSE